MSILGDIGGAVQSAISAVESAFTPASQGQASALQDVVNAFGGGIPLLSNSFTNVVAQPALDSISSAINELSGNFQQIPTEISNSLSSIGNTLSSSFGDVTNYIGSKLGDLWNGIQSGFNNVTNYIGNQFQSFGGTLSNIYNSTVEPIVSSISNNIGAVENSVKDLGTNILSSLGGEINTVSQSVGSIISTVENIPQALGNLATNLFGGSLPLAAAQNIPQPKQPFDMIIFAILFKSILED